MLLAGADRVRDRVIRATERKQMTRLAPVRERLVEWLPSVAANLGTWAQNCQSTRGPKPISLLKLNPAHLTAIPTTGEMVALAHPEVMALVGLRTILDGVATERTGLTGIAMEIGRTCEHEQQVRLWEAADRELFEVVQNHLRRSDATSGHRRRVNINRFNHLRETGKLQVEWQRWTQEEQLRVGLTLLDIVVQTTGVFEVQPDPTHVWKKGSKKGPKSVLVVKEGFSSWLTDAFRTLEVRSPVFKPTIIPPKPWTNTREGGYWTEYVRTPRLIRFKAHQEAQKEWAADEYEAIDMPLVYEAINWLQDRPWRINRRVLDVANEVWHHSLGLGDIPLKESVERPRRPPEADTDEEVEKQWKRATSEAIRRDMKRLAEELRMERLLDVAHEFSHEEEFFFPHMMDFRGRMYPIPVGLQPQGDDLARGLLEFADGKEVLAESGGGEWLAIHLSGCWGFDKASYEDRIAWVREKEDLWRRIAADPLGNTEWAVTKGPFKVDKPWCALAAIFEWVGYLDSGEAFISHIPVSVDGTCNGIQHLSAMTRDEVAGRHVNLVPGEKPRDIYKFVAGRLQERLEDIEKGLGVNAPHARYWLDLCNRDLPRGLTKRQVMVLPYGGTKDSFFEYTREWLDENDPLPEGLDFKSEATRAMLQERSQRVAFLVGHLWDTVKSVVSGGMEVMEWLQKTAKVTTKGNQPIFWTTPSGFVVRHFYGQLKEKMVETALDGQRVQLRLGVQTADLDAPSQLRGIAPNFVHSLDASALALSLIAARERKLAGFTAVHDAYGTHAADMWALFHILREAFVLVHSENMLVEFRKGCSLVVSGFLLAGQPELDFEKATELASEQLPALPSMGRLDLGDVLSSDYFFA